MMRYAELQKDMPVLWKERNCWVAELDDFTMIAYIQCPSTPGSIPVEAQELEPAVEIARELKV